MPVTYSATPLGTGQFPYRSAVRDSLISIQLATCEVVTLVHRLGACPTEIRMLLRSVIMTDSGVPLDSPQVLAMNASQATIYFGDPVGANTPEIRARVDLICEVTHSVVQ